MFYLMCELVPAPDFVPLFVLPSRSGRLRPVLNSQFVSVLRNRLQSAGVPQSHLFRGHSFRRGGTSLAFSSSIPGELIQAFVDWRSDAYKCYLDVSMPLKPRVSQVWLHVSRTLRYKLFGCFSFWQAERLLLFICSFLVPLLLWRS